MQLFHGTSKEAAKQIIQTGFLFGECSDFGRAVYFFDLAEWAKEYSHSDGVVLSCFFDGSILDLSNPEHFEIFKTMDNSKLNEHATGNGFDALKDGHIIAVYSIVKIKNIQPTP